MAGQRVEAFMEEGDGTVSTQNGATDDVDACRQSRRPHGDNLGGFTQQDSCMPL